MLSIILGILFSATLVLCFKYFEIWRIHTVQAIGVNYLVASALGFAFAKSENFGQISGDAEWMWFALGMGVLFIVTFIAVSKTAQNIAVSVAMVASKMSLVIPLSFAVFFLNESMTNLKIIGILLSLGGVVLAVIRPKDEVQTKHHTGFLMKLFLPALVFIGSGSVDASFKFVETRYMNTVDTYLVMAFCYGGAGVCGLLLNGYQWLSHRKIPDKRTIIGGIVLGVLNFYSFYFVLLALHIPKLDSTIVFPVVNVGILVVSTLSAVILFKEKLSPINILGVILSVIAIGLVAFDYVVH